MKTELWQYGADFLELQLETGSKNRLDLSDVLPEGRELEPHANAGAERLPEGCQLEPHANVGAERSCRQLRERADR